MPQWQAEAQALGLQAAQAALAHPAAAHLARRPASSAAAVPAARCAHIPVRLCTAKAASAYMQPLMGELCPAVRHACSAVWGGTGVQPVPNYQQAVVQLLLPAHGLETPTPSPSLCHGPWLSS